MNITKHDRARLDKLKALADRGATEGERKAAREAMDRIMAKYGYRRKEKPKRKAPPKPAEPAAGFRIVRGVHGSAREDRQRSRLWKTLSHIPKTRLPRNFIVYRRTTL